VMKLLLLWMVRDGEKLAQMGGRPVLMGSARSNVDASTESR
jgi:hypothetical protein